VPWSLSIPVGPCSEVAAVLIPPSGIPIPLLSRLGPHGRRATPGQDPCRTTPLHGQVWGRPNFRV